MAPFIATSPNSTLTTSVPNPTTKPFYDLGSVLGIEIVYLIIGGIVLVCIAALTCCIIVLCCKGCKSTKKRNQPKHSKNEKSAPVEMANGMALDWKYTVKGRSMGATQLKSESYAPDRNSIDQESNNNAAHKPFTNQIANDPNEMYSQYVNVTSPPKLAHVQKPASTPTPPPPPAPVTFHAEHTQHAVSFPNYPQAPQSMPNTMQNMGMAAHPNMPTYNNYNQFANYNQYQYPQSVPNNQAKMLQIASGTDHNINNNNFEAQQSAQSAESSEESSSEYQTEFGVSTTNFQSVRNVQNAQNPQVVDTLTTIINNANQNNGSHVLPSPKAEMNEMQPRISIGESTVGFNREPSFGPTDITSLAPYSPPPQ